MDFDVQIKEYKTQRFAAVRAKATINKVTPKVRQLLQETADYLESQGIEPVGPPFGIYYEVSSFLVDVEAGYPVDAEIEGNERVHGGTVPGGKAAVAVYEGVHSDIKEAHRAVHNWMHAHDVKSSGDPTREVYLSDLRDIGDDDACRVESVWPIEATQPLTRAERRRQEREKQAPAQGASGGAQAQIQA